MKRLDISVSEKFGIPRDKAKEMIKAGNVQVDGVVMVKPSFLSDGEIEVSLPQKNFVSRGGYKLDHALDEFHINVEDKICIDIGASTGGFTDCLLQRGAKQVIAIDVGTAQLVQKIKDDSRVISMEQTNIKDVELGLTADIIVMDLSFVSLTKVLDKAYALLKEKGICVCLVKPQFEVGKGNLTKKGIVKSRALSLRAVKNVCNYSTDVGFKIKGQVDSPITGKDGNEEFLLYLQKGEFR